MVRRKTLEEKVTFFQALDQTLQALDEYKEDPQWDLPPYLPMRRVQLFLNMHEEWKKPFYAYTVRKGRTNRLATRFIRMYRAMDVDPLT